MLAAPGKKFLLLRSDIAPERLETLLRRQGATADRVTAYRTRALKAPAGAVRELLSDPPDYVAFTSSSGVNNFIKTVGLQKVKKLSRRSVFASIGPVTSRTLKQHGFKTRCQAKIYNIDGLVEAVSRFQSRQTPSMTPPPLDAKKDDAG